MDTKLKRYNILFKFIAFLLIAVITCYTMRMIINLESSITEYSWGVNHYTETYAYWNEQYRLRDAMETIIRYKSEQNIMDGKTVSQSDINRGIKELYYEIMYDFSDTIYEFTYEYEDGIGIYSDNFRDAINRFKEDYAVDINNMKNELIQDQLIHFNHAVSDILNTPNIRYYINTGECILHNGGLINKVDNNHSEKFREIADSKYSYEVSNYIYSNDTLISEAAFAFNEEYINGRNTDFLNAKQEVTDFIIRGSVCLALFLLCLAYLIFAAGKTTVISQGIHSIYIDKIYNDITVVLLFLSGYAVIACGAVIYDDLFQRNFMYVLLVSSVWLAVAFLLMLVRHYKNRTLLSHTAIAAMFRFLFLPVKKVYDCGSIMVKAAVLVTAFGLLTVIPYVFLITIPLALVFTYFQVTKYIAVKEGVKNIKSGTYHQKIMINGNGEISALAADINDISAGLGKEIERRLKSERLKTELIVNVSHDIKTPLTSVITYVDLLKKENIDNENARKYIDVIAGKSNRLKNLIDDLFDAAKAASGNVAVHYEEVDIHSLITQGLGELDDRIKSSSLDFKISLPKDKIIAYADGRLTWRVLENLLSNVFKYSLPHSRVYIDVFEDKHSAYVEIKNISATELNIPEDEIMERFKRGDESRNSEGSGLGLDIAKSLMLCQNGELMIKIDGDLFKAKLKISKVLVNT